MTQAKAFLAGTFLLGAVAACGQTSEPVEPSATTDAEQLLETAEENAATSELSDSTDAAVVEAESRVLDPRDLMAAVSDDEEDHAHGEDHGHEDHDHDHDEEHDHDHDEAHDHDEHDHEHDHAHDDDDHRHGGEAHVHGAAEFSLATTDTGAEAEFRSPLYNLVGFEHEPQNAEQAAAMDTLVSQLADSSIVFVPSETAGCSTIDSSISVERDGDHGSATASYLMTCQDVSQIDSIAMTAFATYSNIDSIDVVFIGEGNQSAGTATSDAPSFEIDG